MSNECDHSWVPSTDADGVPQYRTRPDISRERVVNCYCSKCGAQTWLSESVVNEMLGINNTAEDPEVVEGEGAGEGEGEDPEVVEVVEGEGAGATVEGGGEGATVEGDGSGEPAPEIDGADVTLPEIDGDGTVTQEGEFSGDEDIDLLDKETEKTEEAEK